MSMFTAEYQDFKREDPTVLVKVTLYDDQKNVIKPVISKAKLVQGTKYAGDYKITQDGDQYCLSTKQVAKLPSGSYGMELWGDDGSIYPSAGFIPIRIHRNADNSLEQVDPTVDLNKIIEDMHNAGLNLVFDKIELLDSDQPGSITSSVHDGKNHITLKIPRGIKGDPGAPGKPGIQGLPGKDGKTPVRGVDYWTDADKQAIQAEDQKYIENTLSKINLEPETFENEAALKAKYPNGKPGLMVTADTGHKWLYVNGVWKDCGQWEAWKSDSGVIDNHDNTITANNLTYDLSKSGLTPLQYVSSGSFNDLPLGTVLADATLMTDGPDKYHGFTTTTFYSTAWDGRRSQIAIADNTNLMYLRVYANNTWESWSLLANGDFYKPGQMTNAETGSPYDDLNTFPLGQTVTIAETPDKVKQIKNLPPISNTTGGLTVRTEPSTAKYAIGAFQIAIDNNNVMYHRINWGGSGHWGAWRSDSVDEHSNDMILPSLSLFQKVGVVGDSYASGELAFDGQYVDHYEISWLQILARKDGFTGTNFSKGGMSTRTWLTNPKCMPLMQSSDAQDLYILALGINDEALGASYIGSEADIDNGADTFYGNYGKIIKAIQTKAPQAKLVIATTADSSDIATQFNEAITTIANHFTIPVIVQLDDPLFNSSYYKDNMIGGHPTGPVYASMAEAFERLIGQSMIDHLDYYKTFKKDV